jgi:hypothetical protein
MGWPRQRGGRWRGLGGIQPSLTAPTPGLWKVEAPARYPKGWAINRH